MSLGPLVSANWSRLVPGEKYTHDEVLMLMGGDTEDNRNKIISAVARGDLWITNDWQIKVPSND